ncbi:MAG: UDP-N-acetylmuramoyl-L-alanyl-D-glutamate--2,6-diaminopimelate ligase [Porticoccaceae bacterium]
MSAMTSYMPLGEIAPQFAPAAQNLPITGLSSDSRTIEQGNLFVALRGYGRPGTDFAREAVQAGAVAVISDLAEIQQLGLDVPVALEPELATRLSLMAGEFYGHPSQSLDVIGITGTNGKTSCCFWLSWLLNQLGKPTGHIGTLGAGMPTEQGFKSTGFTTPDPIQVQRLLSECLQSDAEAVVMEVSSHGLDQGRVAAIRFDAALFTNLSRDHLDYHADMEAYLQAKLRLFKQAGLKRAIVNLDEPASSRVFAELDPQVESFGYSLFDADADLYFLSIVPVTAAYEVEMGGLWGLGKLRIPVVGRYNLSNILAVTATLLARGYALKEIAPMLEQLPSVPGRMQIVEPAAAELPRVIVDYAHTPDAVAAVLSALREQTAGKLIAVIGCGGNRDKAKRPLMAREAVAHSDLQVFTSDNPRNEDPLAILDEMQKGVSDAASVQIIEDRRKAIEWAVNLAAVGDLVAVLGKGHENYQLLDGRRIDFSDADVCRKALERRLSV